MTVAISHIGRLDSSVLKQRNSVWVGDNDNKRGRAGDTIIYISIRQAALLA